MDNPVIVSAVRTPIGKFLGSLAGIAATKLGALVVKEAIERAGLKPEQVDEVIMGNVVGAGLGQNPARQASIFGGVPDTVPALTINKVCGSGLKAVVLGAQAIKCGDAEIVVAGGMESMSNTPYLLKNARGGFRMGNQLALDSMIHDGLWDAYHDYHMGNTGEVVAERWKVTRDDQDQWALDSHKKAIAAIDAGMFKREIVPVEIPGKKGATIVFDTDEGPRRDTTLEKMATLKPLREGGRLTAAVSSQISDASAALLIASERAVKEHGLKPRARVHHISVRGADPVWMLTAPIPATKYALGKAGMTKNDIDLVEINEAFASVVLAWQKETGFDPAKVNVNGGAIALGHPLGATGARLMTTLLNELERTDGRYGLQTMCEGGGQANVTIIERM